LKQVYTRLSYKSLNCLGSYGVTTFLDDALLDHLNSLPTEVATLVIDLMKHVAVSGNLKDAAKRIGDHIMAKGKFIVASVLRSLT